jgi:hypothetical protein
MEHIISHNMVQHNWNMRLFNLSQVVDHTTSSIWGQGWVTSYFLGFREGDLLRWGLYVDKLKSSHIRLIDNEESLVWIHTTWPINHKQGLELYSINVFENNQSGGGRLFAISTLRVQQVDYLHMQPSTLRVQQVRSLIQKYALSKLKRTMNIFL